MKKTFRILAFIMIVTFIIPINSNVPSFMDNSVYASSGLNTIKTRGLVFREGMVSDQIRLLKDFFRARKDKNVPWGYSYDTRTKQLVSNYQREKGLGTDGIAGKSTIDRINKDIVNNKYSLGVREPATSLKGDMIIINKSSNTLYHMKNGKIYKSYPVATGKNASFTPDGKHRVIKKFKNPAWGGAGVSSPIPGGAPNNPLGKRWIGLSVGGGGKYGIHGNSNAKSIGQYASLGCVRMFNEDVEKLYDEVKFGTPVWIGSESTLIKYGVRFNDRYPSQSGSKPVEDKNNYPESKNIKVKLNGKLVKLEGPLLNNNGRTYYPFREMLEKVDAEVKWNGKDRSAIGILDGNVVEFKVDSNEYKVNGVTMKLPKGQKAFLNKDEKTYIPLRYAMEGLGFEVVWEESTRTVLINKNEVEEEPEIEEPEESEEIEEDLEKKKNTETNIDTDANSDDFGIYEGKESNDLKKLKNRELDREEVDIDLKDDESKLDNKIEK